MPDPLVKRNKDGYYEPRCLIIAELTNGYKVLVTHLGLNEDEREFELSIIEKYISDSKCILLGDFNITDERFLLEHISNKLVNVLPSEKQKNNTFPSDNPIVKIDYILVSPDIEVEKAYVSENVVSDHLSYIAVI